MKLGDRDYLRLRRLHALSGIVPVGLFLIAHLAVNFTAVFGPATFDRVSARLERIPAVGWLELFAIGVPIAAHIVLGALLGNAAQSFTTPHGYPRPGLRTLQRWTGGILVTYVLFHVWSTRLAPGAVAGEPFRFEAMSRHLASTGVVALYAVAVLAAAAHFGVGLFEVAYRWRPAAGRAPRPAALGWTVFVLLSLIGLAAIAAFASPRGRWLERLTAGAPVLSAHP